MNYVRFMAIAMLVSFASAQLSVQANPWEELGFLSQPTEESVVLAPVVIPTQEVPNNDASNVGNSVQSEQVVSAELPKGFVQRVQELCQNSTDFASSLCKEFGNKFTQLTQDHPYYYVAAKGIVGFVVVGGVCYAIYKTGLVSTCSEFISKRLQKIQQSATIRNPKLVAVTGALSAATIGGIAGVNYYKPELTSALVSNAQSLLANAGNWIAQKAGAVAAQLPALSTMKNMLPTAKVVYGISALAAVGALSVLAYKYRTKFMPINKDVAEKLLAEQIRINLELSNVSLD